MPTPMHTQDQVKLAAEHPSNPLLQYRGNAGTHDLELGAETLKRLRGLRSPQDTASVPRCVGVWAEVLCLDI